MIDLDFYINNLNLVQKKAVETLQGPVLVIAGPGTGKTQVLALRIANIIKQTDTSPSNILCLTFTESGVSAMRNRLISFIGKEAFYVRIHTFHSFCNEVIQMFPEKFAFARDLIQLDDLNRLKVIQSIIDELDTEKKYQLRPLHDKYFYQNEILKQIQTLKREGISDEQLNKVARDSLSELEQNVELNKRTGKPTSKWNLEVKNYQKLVELSEIYHQYNKNLIESGFYDYEDMILFVNNKFLEDDELLAFYQEKFLYILVDEYQDTNGSQNQLLKTLGNFDESPNIFAVGDDDQAIYRFQGGNVENLLFFEKQFKDTTIIPIDINYRSSQLILDLASSSIKNNKARLVNLIPHLSKNLKAGIKIPNNKTEIYSFSHYENENKFISQKIKELHSSGVNYSDIAIFYRRHNDSNDIVEALLKSDIPIRLAAGKNTLDEIVVQKFINLLKVIYHQDENLNFILFEVLFYEFLGLERIDVFKLVNSSSLNKEPLFNLMLDLEYLKKSHYKQPEKINNLANKIIEWREAASNLTLMQFIEKIADESGYLNSMFDGETDIEAINSINSLFSYIRNINMINKRLTLREFLDDIKLLEKNKLNVEEKELDIKKDGVNLMTAHKSKGLEFKYVFIAKFYDKNWGGNRSRSFIKIPLEKFPLSNVNVIEKVETDFEIEDERRLFFVALTRAKEQIYITYAKIYPSGNTTKEVSPSQFIFELDKDLITNIDTSSEEIEDLEYFKQNLNPSRLASPYTIEEKEYLKSIIKDFKLSATGLKDYIECPLKFKFTHLFKVPKPIQRNAILGSAVHFALENYFRLLKNNEKKDLKFLIDKFDYYVKKQLIGEEDTSLVLTEGNKIISDYYDHYKNEFIPPLEVEYAFKGKNVVFEIPGEDPIIIKGRLDRIDWMEDQNIKQRTNFDIRITDYKVMVPQSQNSIKGGTKSSKGLIFKQLMFYKLLADSDPLFRQNVLSPRYNVSEVCIDFIKPNRTGIYKIEHFAISDSEYQEFKEEVIDIVKRIRNLEFSGSEKYPLCGECEYCKFISHS